MKIEVKPTDKKIPFSRLLFISLILYILIIASLFPSEWFENITGGPVCLFKRFTGKPCLFCGITSSLLSSFRFNFKEAFLYNPAGPFIFLAFIFTFINIILIIPVKKIIMIALTKIEKFILMSGIITLLLVNWIYKILNT